MKIAYIAPELPGLSSTFVYKEIFVLSRHGESILPYTIHENIPNPETEELKRLKSQVQRLYGRNISFYLSGNLGCMSKFPGTYLKTFFIAVKDSIGSIGKPKIMLGIIYRFFVSAALAKDLSHKEADHIHAHFAHFPADIAMYTGLIAGIPFSLTAHANDIFSNSWLLPEKTSRASFIATISEYNRSYLENLGCDPAKIEIVRCGVDVPNALPESNHQEAANRIGFIGRMVEKKGLEFLIDACAKLKDKGMVFSLEIVGSGPLERNMRNLVAQLGLEKEVIFLGGIPNDEVISWVKGLDLFVLPCVKDVQGDMDGIPVALMEAMLFSVPVISTRLSGIPELVIDGKTGLLSEPGNMDELAEKVNMILVDAEMRSQLSKNAISLVKSEFDASKNALKLLGLFRRSNACNEKS